MNRLRTPMSKSKLQRHIRDKERQLQLRATQPTPVKTHKVLLEVLGGIATLLTIAAFYLSYIVPKLSVGVSGSLQAANPMATVFHLSNDGALPIHSVVAACGAPQFIMGKWEVKSEPDARVIFPESKAEIL